MTAPFSCAICQQPINSDNGLLIWPHLPPTQTITKPTFIHDGCRSAFIQSQPNDSTQHTSAIHLQDLPSDLIGVVFYGSYLVGYSASTMLCLHHKHHLHPRTSIHPVWQLRIHDYEFDDATLYNNGRLSILVPEFMEASWIHIQIESGQILQYAQDLYDITIRLFAANRSGARLKHPTFL